MEIFLFYNLSLCVLEDEGSILPSSGVFTVLFEYVAAFSFNGLFVEAFRSEWVIPVSSPLSYGEKPSHPFFPIFHSHNYSRTKAFLHTE